MRVEESTYLQPYDSVAALVIRESYAIILTPSLLLAGTIILSPRDHLVRLMVVGKVVQYIMASIRDISANPEQSAGFLHKGIPYPATVLSYAVLSDAAHMSGSSAMLRLESPSLHS